MTYQALEQLSQLYDGYQREFMVEGQAILLCQLDGELFLIENRCPHMDVPLTHASLLPNQKIRCRAHGIEFDLPTGKACGPLSDTLDCLKKYTPIYEGTSIGVDIEALSPRNL